MVDKIVRDFGHHGSVVLKGDREHALANLLSQVASLRSQRTHIEESALGDSQSNGRAERAVQNIEMMSRNLKLALERQLSRTIPVECELFS